MKLARVVLIAGVLLGLLPAGSANAFDKAVDCGGTLMIGGVSIGVTGQSSITHPVNYSHHLLTWQKWAQGDQIKIKADRPTGTTLEILLDDQLMASGPYPELTYMVTKRQIAYLTVVMNSAEVDQASAGWTRLTTYCNEHCRVQLNS